MGAYPDSRTSDGDRNRAPGQPTTKITRSSFEDRQPGGCGALLQCRHGLRRRAESFALIESQLLAPVPRLSRRRRFAPMSVYVAGDMAVTTFARRGAGCTWHDRHVFAFREDGQWVFVGGSGNNSQDHLLGSPDHFACLPELGTLVAGRR